MVGSFQVIVTIDTAEERDRNIGSDKEGSGEGEA